MPRNISIFFCLKQTLDIESIKKLQEKDKIIEYYQFFEKNYHKPIEALNKDNITMGINLPNTAVPSPITKQNGIEFANLCRLSYEIECENKTQHYFDYFTQIVPFTGYNNPLPENEYLQVGPKGCGTGVSNISFLPNNLFCTCHLSYMEFIDKYKQYVSDGKRQNKVIDLDKFMLETRFNTCMTEEQYDAFMDDINNPMVDFSTCRLNNMYSIISILALAHQIDEKYLDQEEAAKAARLVQNHTSYCINDNANVNGSMTLQPVGLFKQLLNGAMDYILKSDEENPRHVE